MIHSLAWFAWVLSALIALSSTRNPLYLLPLLLSILIVSDTVTQRAKRTQGISPLRMLLLVTLFGGLLNAIMVRAGQTVLVRLPAWVPLIGNTAFTAEAFLYGALNGLAIAGFLFAFGVLNAAMPMRTLVQRIPRAFYPLAVVTCISVTFVPFTLRQLTQIRDAQALRGHEMRGPRDWLPVFMPLLVGGLERALQLAETMVSRGFAGTEAQETTDTRTPLATILALLSVLCGWVLELVWGQTYLGGGLIALGILVLVYTLRVLGRRTEHTSYRQERWHAGDGCVVGMAIVVAGAFCAPWPAAFRASLYYYPYPLLSLPGINPWLFCATLGLLAPVILFALRPEQPST
jgi:energy-coupling factor transport system permease protein